MLATIAKNFFYSDAPDEARVLLAVVEDAARVSSCITGGDLLGKITAGFPSVPQSASVLASKVRKEEVGLFQVLRLLAGMPELVHVFLLPIGPRKVDREGEGEGRGNLSPCILFMSSVSRE